MYIFKIFGKNTFVYNNLYYRNFRKISYNPKNLLYLNKRKKGMILIMTSKELLYIEDALGHENFMKSCASKTSSKLTDPTLSTYIGELVQKHEELKNSFLNLL